MALVKISASQIATVRDCPAKVCFDKVDGLPRTGSPAAQLGTDIHAEVENYFRDGTPVSSAFAMALLQNLPARTENNLVPEREFSFLWPKVGVQVNGYIDLLWLAKGSPEVHDHKSTGKLSRAKTPEDLLSDPQAIFYGMEAVLEHHAAYGETPDAVVVQLGYVETVEKARTPPRTQPVRQRLTILDIEQGLTSLEPAALLLKRIHTERISGAQASELGLANPGSCWNFGRCPYADKCPSFPKPKSTVTKMKESNVSLDLLAALSALGAAPTPEPTPFEAEVVSPPASPEGTEPTLLPFDVSGVQDVVVAVNPPDAAPNVSASDPPPPPLKPSTAKGAKAARARAVAPPVSSASPMLSLYGVAQEVSAESDQEVACAALKRMVVSAMDKSDYDSAEALIQAIQTVRGTRHAE